MTVVLTKFMLLNLYIFSSILTAKFIIAFINCGKLELWQFYTKGITKTVVLTSFIILNSFIFYAIPTISYTITFIQLFTLLGTVKHIKD